MVLDMTETGGSYALESGLLGNTVTVSGDTDATGAGTYVGTTFETTGRAPTFGSSFL